MQVVCHISLLGNTGMGVGWVECHLWGLSAGGLHVKTCVGSGKCRSGCSRLLIGSHS